MQRGFPPLLIGPFRSPCASCSAFIIPTWLCFPLPPSPLEPPRTREPPFLSPRGPLSVSAQTRHLWDPGAWHAATQAHKGALRAAARPGPGASTLRRGARPRRGGESRPRLAVGSGASHLTSAQLLVLQRKSGWRPEDAGGIANEGGSMGTQSHCPAAGWFGWGPVCTSHTCTHTCAYTHSCPHIHILIDPPTQVHRH